MGDEDVSNFLEESQVEGTLERSDQPPNYDSELKSLPSSLKYAFLGPKVPLLIIISSHLSSRPENSIIEVLRKHKSVIGWTLDDIKRIYPDVCEHKIFIEENAKPSREPQCKLNPHMVEILEKEMLKLLKVDVIYAISDSSWVSSIHMVPKK